MKKLTMAFAIYVLSATAFADNLLDKHGNLEGFVQENGSGYMFLSPEGEVEGFYQED